MKNTSLQDLDLDHSGEDGERLVPSPLDWARLLLRAPMRRKVLFTAVLVAGFAAVVAFYRLKTPTYRVEAKILAQQQQVVPSSFRMGPEENPVRTAWELIHRRDNLLVLLKNAKLLEGSPPSDLDRLRTKVGLQTRGDPRDDLVNLLDKRLLVVTEEGTITISLDWPVPEQAYAIVEGALQNFIEARHVQEVTAIDEVMSVLRARAASAREQLEHVTREVRRESPEAYREAPVTAAAPPPATEGASPELVRLRSLLESKERAIQDVEEFRRRRVADLHAQLDEKRTTYSEAHPSVIQLRQDIDALSKDSPQLLALQGEAAKLRTDYQARLAHETTASAAAAPSAAASRASPRTRTPVSIEEDERVRDARFQYQQITERVNAAQLELDALRAAFKYRYNVVWPPQIPRDPVSPNPLKIFGMGFMATLLLAFLMAALPDLSSGRIVERWQVERGLGITVLGEIEKKPSRKKVSAGSRAGRG